MWEEKGLAYLACVTRKIMLFSKNNTLITLKHANSSMHQPYLEWVIIFRCWKHAVCSWNFWLNFQKRHCGQDTFYRKLASQSTYSINNTGYFITSWTLIFIHNFSNEDSEIFVLFINFALYEMWYNWKWFNFD